MRESRYCSDISDAPPCCWSCHDDFNDGYDLPFDATMHDGTEARVCCTVLHFLKEEADV
jgi:hypothetical protein